MAVTFAQYTMKALDKNELSTNTYGIPVISDNCKIIDSRILKDFKDQTFGGYKLSQATFALDKAIIEDKLEPALHWCLQLFFSGIVTPLWYKLIYLGLKNINIYNFKLPEFLYNKTLQWHKIVDNHNFNKDNILLLRNHPTVRLLLAELVTILVLSRKHKLPTLPKIKKEEFIIDNFRAKLEAKDNSLISIILMDGDPSEIKIAVNEMAFHLYHNNSMKALYWLNWIIEWEKINTKKYGKYECASRPIEGIDGKFFKDVVWLLWAIVNRIRQIKYTVIGKDLDIQIGFLWKMYTNKFTPSSRNKKQGLIIWAILLMTETIDTATQLVDRPTILFQSLLGFDKIVASLKSQQVNHIVNNAIMNVVVENNYMMTEKHKELEVEKLRKEKEQEFAKRELLAKQKKITVESMNKLNDIYKLDKMMFA
jgi:hypothetical protein